MCVEIDCKNCSRLRDYPECKKYSFKEYKPVEVTDKVVESGVGYGKEVSSSKKNLCYSRSGGRVKTGVAENLG